MKTRIKTKLTLGVGFLFSVIVLLGVLGSVYIYRLSGDSKAILKDNYESLVYAQNMLEALDSENKTSLEDFEENLKLQEENVTEVGEKQLTSNLRVQFENLKNNDSDSMTSRAIRSAINEIVKVNLEAIVRKNAKAESSSTNAILYLSIITTFCVLATFTFIINFPSYIANPIQELTVSIKEIANRNYDERLHFASRDEFGELAEAFNSMAEKLEAYEKSNLAKIIFEKKRIEAIINKMADPIVGLDEKKQILFVNTEAIKILGISEVDLLGRYAPDVAVNNDLLRNLIKGIINPDIFETDQEPIKIFSEGKANYYLRDLLKVATVQTGEKKVSLIGYVIILKNITPFKELDLAKTNFMATISHELKTPLSSIQMCAQLLDDNRVGELNAEQKELLKTVNQEVNRLLKITSELLNLAQVETGNIRLQIKSVKPLEIIDYAYKALLFQAGQKGLEIEIQCPDDLPLIKADLDKTAWVMVNLLSNAIHYSPEKGKVLLQARRNYNKVIFTVQDYGKGIDPKHKDHVFDKFYKIPGSDPGKSGTGLGLAISKEFISSEGGKIWVESEIGKGSKFSFELNAEIVNS